MELTGRTVLVTGGGSGIGLALAQRFLGAGNAVVVCGRRPETLEAARRDNPGLATIVADVATPEGRLALAERVVADYPALDVLVNNAGVQRRGRVTEGAAEWAAHAQEIAINLEAPIHLTMALWPHLAAQPKAAVLNVSSGLAFAPLPFAAIYSATKAALHSYTQSLRVQAEGSAVEVIEVIPPAVQTDLGGAGLHTFGVPLADFADAVWAGLEAGRPEIAYGTAEAARTASRAELDAALARMKGLRP